MTTFLPVTIDQPAGTMKLAPAAVTRCVSAFNCSGADLASAAGAAACIIGANGVLWVSVGIARTARTAKRRIVMCITIVEGLKWRTQRYTVHSGVVKMWWVSLVRSGVSQTGTLLDQSIHQLEGFTA